MIKKLANSLLKSAKPALLSIAPSFAYCLTNLLYATYKNTYNIPSTDPCCLIDIDGSARPSSSGSKENTHENLIISFWHSDILLIPLMYQHFNAQNHRQVLTKIIASNHKDGNIIAKYCAKYGFVSIRGSTNKGGIKALKESLGALKRGYDIGICPDGPRGPRHSIADGIVAMAARTQTRIIPFHVHCDNAWEFNTWDRFKIPKPFSTIEYRASAPFSIPKDMELEAAKRLVFAKMMELEGSDECYEEANTSKKANVEAPDSIDAKATALDAADANGATGAKALDSKDVMGDAKCATNIKALDPTLRRSCV